MGKVDLYVCCQAGLGGGLPASGVPVLWCKAPWGRRVLLASRMAFPFRRYQRTNDFIV